MSRRITITTRVSVTLECFADEDAGEINITRVLRAHAPSEVEVMEALDAEGQLEELDRLFAEGDAS